MISDEQIADYNEQGYTVCENLIHEETLTKIRQELDDVASGSTLANFDAEKLEMEPDQADDGTLIRRIFEPCARYDKCRALSESDGLLDCVEKLIGHDIYLHYSKVNMKPAGIGSVVNWHQDFSYYPLTNRDHVAVLIYLDDASEENGCLQVIPNAHKDALLDHTTDGFFQGRITEDVSERPVKSVPGKAGSVIFLHCMTPHSSLTNTSKDARRTLIMGYYAADAIPLFFSEYVAQVSKYTKLVRGKVSMTARIDITSTPIPILEKEIASLYEIQKNSRDR